MSFAQTEAKRILKVLADSGAPMRRGSAMAVLTPAHGWLVIGSVPSGDRWLKMNVPSGEVGDLVRALNAA